jgi:hypothetical protein
MYPPPHPSLSLSISLCPSLPEENIKYTETPETNPFQVERRKGEERKGEERTEFGKPCTTASQWASVG